MADEEDDYKVGPGRPPLHTRFQNGERRKITKRKAVVHQLVNKLATADLRATKSLFAPPAAKRRAGRFDGEVGAEVGGARQQHFAGRDAGRHGALDREP
jgi:hypothetical protein